MMKIEDGGFSGLRQLNKQLQELASALQARFKPSSSREGQQVRHYGVWAGWEVTRALYASAGLA